LPGAHSVCMYILTQLSLAVDEMCRNIQVVDIVQETSSCVRQLSSISSQDSGFVSHDVLPSSDVSHSHDISSVLKVSLIVSTRLMCII